MKIPFVSFVVPATVLSTALLANAQRDHPDHGEHDEDTPETAHVLEGDGSSVTTPGKDTPVTETREGTKTSLEWADPSDEGQVTVEHEGGDAADGGGDGGGGEGGDGGGDSGGGDAHDKPDHGSRDRD